MFLRRSQANEPYFDLSPLFLICISQVKGVEVELKSESIKINCCDKDRVDSVLSIYEEYRSEINSRIVIFNRNTNACWTLPISKKT